MAIFEKPHQGGKSKQNSGITEKAGSDATFEELPFGWIGPLIRQGRLR